MTDSTENWGNTPERLFEAKLNEALAAMKLDLPEMALQQLKGLYEMIAEVNRHTNLVSDASPEIVAVRHIADSLLLLTTDVLDELEVRNAVDVGSGAGFPGMVLAIAQPDVHWLLVEATGKKARFIEDVIFSLGLDNCSVSCSRAEALGRNAVKRESNELVVARGLAPCNVLCELCLPFLKIGGRMVAYKGPEGEKEAMEATFAAAECGGTLLRTPKALLPLDDHTRTFPTWEKVKPTSSRYPRREGKPQKSPLRG